MNSQKIIKYSCKIIKSMSNYQKKKKKATNIGAR